MVVLILGLVALFVIKGLFKFTGAGASSKDESFSSKSFEAQLPILRKSLLI